MLEKRRNPYVATDGVIIDQKRFSIVLIKRKKNPFKDYWALPGGFVEWGETVENACLREIREETSLDVEIVDLIGVFSDPNRDPRGHVISIAFLCVPLSSALKAMDDASYAAFINLNKILDGEIKLAFDHYDIVLAGLKKAKEKGVLS